MVSIERTTNKAKVTVQYNKELVLRAHEMGVLPKLVQNQQDLLNRRYLSGDEVQPFRELSDLYAKEGRIVSFQALKHTETNAIRRIKRELEGKPSALKKQPTEEISAIKLVIDYNLQSLTIRQMARKYGVSDDTMRQYLVDNNIAIRSSGARKGS